MFIRFTSNATEKKARKIIIFVSMTTKPFSFIIYWFVTKAKAEMFNHILVLIFENDGKGLVSWLFSVKKLKIEIDEKEKLNWKLSQVNICHSRGENCLFFCIYKMTSDKSLETSKCWWKNVNEASPKNFTQNSYNIQIHIW